MAFVCLFPLHTKLTGVFLHDCTLTIGYKNKKQDFYAAFLAIQENAERTLSDCESFSCRFILQCKAHPHDGHMLPRLTPTLG